MLRVTTRVLIVDGEKILLVRNKDANFWYPPGGGWEFRQENLEECVVREVKEETGYTVIPEQLLCLREFHEDDKTSLEVFWRSTPSPENNQTIEKLNDHIDEDENGSVEEAKWFTINELKDVKVLPKFTLDLIDVGEGKTNYYPG